MLPNLINRTTASDEPQLKQNRLPLTQNSRNISDVFNRHLKGYENYPSNYQNKTANLETAKKNDIGMKLPPIDKQYLNEPDIETLDRTHDKKFYEQQIYGMPNPHLKVLADNQDLLAERVNELGALLSQTIAGLNTINKPVKDIEAKLRRLSMNNDESTESLKARVEQLEKKNRDLEYMIESKLKIDEIAIVKSTLEKKIFSDQEFFQKQSEKSRVLFEEMTRLNQSQQLNQQKLKDIDNRISLNNSNVEAKMMEIERSAIDFLSKDEQIKQLMRQMAEKSGGVTRDLEHGINGLQKEHIKLQEGLNGMREVNKRSADELRAILESFSIDFNSKIENRTQNLDLRLKAEKDERLRAIENVIGQLEARYNVIDDRARSDREAARNACKSLESSIQWELKRKDELIELLRGEQNSHMNRTLLQIEKITTDFNLYRQKLEDDISDTLEGVNAEIAEVRDKIIDNNEKVGEIVRSEVKARFESDIELKNLASDIFDTIRKELAELQDHVVVQNEKLVEDIHKQNREHAERIDMVSRYVDSEISAVNSSTDVKLNDLKSVTNQTSKEFNTKIETQKIAFDQFKDEVDQIKKTINGKIDANYIDLETKLKTNVKLLSDNLADTNDRMSQSHQLQSKAMSVVSNNVKKMYQSLRSHIDNQTKSLNNQLDVKSDQLKILESNFKTTFEQVNQQINGNFTTLETNCESLKSTIAQESSKIHEDVTKVNNLIVEAQKIATENLNQQKSQFETNMDTLKSNLDNLKKANDRVVNDLNTQFFETLDNITVRLEKIDEKREKQNMKIDAVQTIVDSNIQRIGVLEVNGKTLETNLVVTSQKIVNQDIEIVRLTQNDKNIKELIEAINKSLDDINKNLKDATEGLNNNSKELARIDEVKLIAENNKKRIEVIEINEKSTELTLGLLNEKTTGFDNDIGKLYTEDKNIKEAIETTNKNLATTEKALKDATEGMGSYKKELGSMSEKNKQGESKLDDVYDSLRKHTGQIETLQNADLQTKDSIDFINEKLVQQSDINSQVDMTIKLSQEQEIKLLSRVDALEATDKMNKEIQSVQSDVNKSIQNTISAYNDRLTDQENMSKTNIERINSLNTRIETTEYQLKTIGEHTNILKETETQNGEASRQKETELRDQLHMLEDTMMKRLDETDDMTKRISDDIRMIEAGIIKRLDETDTANNRIIDELKVNQNSSKDLTESVFDKMKALEDKVNELVETDKDDTSTQLILKKLDEMVNGYTLADTELRKSLTLYVDAKIKELEIPSADDNRFIQIDEPKKIPVKNVTEMPKDNEVNETNDDDADDLEKADGLKDLD